MTLNGKQQRTLARILERPTRSDVTWSEVQSLLDALGVEVTNGKGSRRRLSKYDDNGEIMARANIHEPHNPAQMRKGAVRDLADLLNEIGA